MNGVCGEKSKGGEFWRSTKECQKQRQLSGPLLPTDAEVRKHGAQTRLDTLVVHVVNVSHLGSDNASKLHQLVLCINGDSHISGDMNGKGVSRDNPALARQPIRARGLPLECEHFLIF
ncbi:hypothetical protein KY289_004021 [Solanum tuberosum]|nr:hypothetical protein KY289_004021 [Solanum tuberosum]